MNDEQVCPRCKTTTYRNPSLILMVNICGHTLCESCVDLLFLKGSGACPECKTPLRRCNFRVQLFDDPMIEKDINIRKRILRDYNKNEDDFATLEDYNNYLEEIESIIYNLSNDIDIINTNKRIEQFKKDNRELILRNKSKMSRNDLELEELIEAEEMVERARLKEVNIKENDIKRQKIQKRNALIHELMSSYENATKIVSQHVKAQIDNQQQIDDSVHQLTGPTKQPSSTSPLFAPPASENEPPRQFSTGIKFTTGSFPSLATLQRMDIGEPFVRKRPVLCQIGPKPPTVAEIIKDKYLRHIRHETITDDAGGYKCIIACERVLQEAFVGIFYDPEAYSDPESEELSDDDDDNDEKKDEKNEDEEDENDEGY